MLVWFVKIKRPIATSSIPLIMDITGKYLEIAVLYFTKLPIARAVNIKGTARPNEYTESKSIPWPMVSKLLAYIRIGDKIGPTQGVQPAAKAIPIRTEPNLPEALLKEKNLFSL